MQSFSPLPTHVKGSDGPLAGRRPRAAWERTLIAAALGDVRGSAGSAALRSAITHALDQLSSGDAHAREEFRDLACACVWALGKRDRAAATGALVQAARHPNPSVSNYGMDVLAAVGDDRFLA